MTSNIEMICRPLHGLFILDIVKVCMVYRHGLTFGTFLKTEKE